MVYTNFGIYQLYFKRKFISILLTYFVKILGKSKDKKEIGVYTI